jgi:two-component system sensor histidine kinase DesK
MSLTACSAEGTELDDIAGTRWRRGGLVLALGVWGVFAVAPIVTFFGHRHSAITIAIVVPTYLAVVGLYVVAMIRKRSMEVGPDAAPLVAVLVALTVVLLAVGGWAFSAMVVFTAVAAGRRLPPHMAAPVVGALAAGVGIGLAASGRGSDAVALAVTTLGLGWWMIGFARLITTVRELHAAREEVARLAVADERDRFARDLHDLLGHSLSVIAVKSDLAHRLLPDRPEQAAAEVADIGKVARRSLAEVREAVAGSRRPTLPAELAGARDALAAAGIEVHADDPPASLPADAEAVLAWAVREATTNVLRHASARRVGIHLGSAAGQATLEVIDDGGGADGRDLDDGSGLAGLAERVARQNGRLEAAPRAEGGFRLAVSVPA